MAVLPRAVSGAALQLYVYLLANAESISGPLGDLVHDRYFRSIGMSKNAIERAGQELAEKGLYSYGWQRRPDGTFARVQGVTEVPDALPRPQPTRRPVSAAGTVMTSGNAGKRRQEQARPAETVAEPAITAGRDQFGPQAQEQDWPAETVAEPAITAGRDQFGPQAQEQVRPAETHPADGVLPGQGGSGSRAHTRYTEREIETPPPSPIDDLPAQRGPREGEGILVSVGQARSWLALLPFRSKIPAATSLGPVVAKFLSAPGPWPKERLAEVLCHDLAGADSVEAVLHGRLKKLTENGEDVYDPANYVQAVDEPGTTIAIEGERVPVEALKPAEHLRTAANTEFRRMREQMRNAGAEGGLHG